MALVLLDLDNTLVDRDAAFRGAVAALLADHGLPATELGSVMAIDREGYAPRDAVVAELANRYGDVVSRSAIRALLDDDAADRAVLNPATARALESVRAAGLASVIVTNGRTAQQEAKIFNTGLDRLVDGWVISERAGIAKPNPQIFRAAAATVGAPLFGAWMIGDSPDDDIAGAIALGLSSAWITNGRSWNERTYMPTYTTDTVAAAIAHILCANIR